MRWPRRRRADGGAPPRAQIGPALGVTGVGLALTLFGLGLAGETVAVPGVALLLLGLLALLGPGLLILGTRVEQQRRPATVVEGQRVTITVHVRAPRLLSRGWGGLVVPGVTEPLVLRGGLQRIELEVVAARRGPLVLPAPAVRLSDPFDLVRLWLRPTEPLEDVLVLPRTETVRWREGAALTGAAGRLRRAQPRGDGAHDPDGLRDYTAGTPATRIFWPALARGGDLLERTYTGDAAEVPLLVLDPRCALATETPALDMVVRGTASLILELATRGEIDVLLPDAGGPVRIGPSLSTWPALWRRLALCPAAPSDTPGPVPAGNPGVVILAAVHPEPGAGSARSRPAAVLTLTPAGKGTRARGSGALAQVGGCELAMAEGPW
ncbi:MAG TPA: DUF58 domain-containing protein [Solirubrobacteraceae bacterium]|nr:DUF58 domain-containing protein [Solirubrobacteraceae bacterium]